MSSFLNCDTDESYAIIAGLALEIGGDGNSSLAKGDVVINTKAKNSIEIDGDELQLVADVEIPGLLRYYGTDDNGNRGWFVITDATAPVLSVFGRIGNIVSQAGDYTAGQVNFDDSFSSLVSDEVQGAIDELDGNISTLGSLVEYTANKGVANGYCPLDASSLIPTSYLPVDTVEFKGTFGSASSTTGGDLPASGNVGDLYICDEDSYSSTNAGITFDNGDSALWDGSDWVKLDNTSNVNSVFSRQGNIVAQAGDYTAGQVDFDNSFSSLASDNVQEAIDELDGRVDTLEGQIYTGSITTGVTSYEHTLTEQPIFAGQDNFVELEPITTIGDSGISQVTTTVLDFLRFKYSGTTFATLKSVKSQIASGMITPQLDDQQGGGYIDLDSVDFSIAAGSTGKPSFASPPRSNTVDFTAFPDSLRVRYKINTDIDISLVSFYGQFYTWKPV